MRWADESHNAVNKAFIDVKLAHFDFIKKQEGWHNSDCQPLCKEKDLFGYSFLNVFAGFKTAALTA